MHDDGHSPGIPERDLAATLPLLRAGGYAVTTLPGGGIGM